MAAPQLPSQYLQQVQRQVLCMKLSNILVVIDPTATRHPALDRAVLLARKCDARIELYACETVVSRDTRYAAHLARGDVGSFVVNLRALLEPLAEPLRQRGIDVSIETTSGDPLHEMLLERIGSCVPDLVVKDTHPHSLLNRALLTHTDWHLIRDCKVPLLLTKPHSWQAAPRIAAAIDPGHVQDRPQALDHRILGCALDLAKQLGGELRVLHAFLPLEIPAPIGAGLGLSTSYAVEATREAEAVRRTQLEKFMSRYELPGSALDMRLGVAAQVLPELAQQLHIDLLVMGAVSRSGLQRLFIGSTAERVLEALPCDVLVIKPPDFVSALPL